jgi:hypothetical protein
MNPYEVERVTQYGSECPNCSCSLYYSDLDDLFEEIEVVKDFYGHNDDVDGYTEWTQVTYIVYSNSDYHQCGCSCYFGYGQPILEEVTANQWEEESETEYACGKCDRNYSLLDFAKECCKNEEFSEEQLVASLFGRESNL